MFLGGIDLLAGRIKKVLSTNIKRLMARDNLKQVALAKATGADASTVNNWVHGRNWPGDEHIDKLMDTFHWTEAELFLGTDSDIAELLRRHNATDSPFVIGLK